MPFVEFAIVLAPLAFIVDCLIGYLIWAKFRGKGKPTWVPKPVKAYLLRRVDRDDYTKGWD